MKKKLAVILGIIFIILFGIGIMYAYEEAGVAYIFLILIAAFVLMMNSKS